jgi:hypothetical protein
MGSVTSHIIVVFTVVTFSATAQFIEKFDGEGRPKGWVIMTGDGKAKIDFLQKNGIGSLHVDGTNDQLNIWWALARHRITGLDMKKLVQPEYELRVEARIKVSHAPRRVNLHFNHQRTTDFHSHLMEFDIPDTTNWHTISMTTSNFEVQIGDSINSHLALMDWGLQKYRIDFDYFKVDVVKRSTATRDLGNPMPYHPPLASPSSFKHNVSVIQDATIDTNFADRNFDSWGSKDAKGSHHDLLSVSDTRVIIMRWDFSDFKGKKTSRSGLLELSPFSVQRSPDFHKDFGMVRIAEILHGDPAWDEKSITFDKLKGSLRIEQVINTQMIIDDSVTWNSEGKVLFTISQPVLQRLIEGKTKGLAIKPLGAVNALFYSRNNHDARLSPRLYFDID